MQNDHPLALTPEQQMQATLRQIEQTVHTMMQHALSLLAPGYKATVLFTFKGKPERDVVLTQAAFEDVLSSLIAKATPAQVASVKNLNTASKMASAQDVEDRLALVRKAMAFLPHMAATQVFRDKMTEALASALPAPKPLPEPTMIPACLNCGSTNLGSMPNGHFGCMDCGNDLTECLQ
jgi:hypothetical protein